MLDLTGHTRPLPSSSTGERDRIAVRLDAAVADRLRDAAFWTPELHLYEIVERALTHYLDQMEAERGGPFPDRRWARPPQIGLENVNIS